MKDIQTYTGYLEVSFIENFIIAREILSSKAVKKN